MNRQIRLLLTAALPLIAFLALAGCNGEDTNDAIVPLQASVVTPAVAGDPVIFFQKSALDTNPTDDVVVVDVMLRTSASLTFSYIDMEVLFDPGVIQVGQVDLTATPLGNCSVSSGTTMLCEDNAKSANQSGDLIIGAHLTGSGSSATVTGTVKLMTLRLIGASVGTSTLDFETARASGDCEILADAGLGSPPVNLNIPCDGTGTVVTVAR